MNPVCTWHSEVDHLLDGVKALPLVRNVEGFEYVREGRVVATHPGDGSLQVQETLLLHTAHRRETVTMTPKVPSAHLASFIQSVGMSLCPPSNQEAACGRIPSAERLLASWKHLLGFGNRTPGPLGVERCVDGALLRYTCTNSGHETLCLYVGLCVD